MTNERTNGTDAQTDRPSTAAGTATPGHAPTGRQPRHGIPSRSRSPAARGGCPAGV